MKTVDELDRKEWTYECFGAVSDYEARFGVWDGDKFLGIVHIRYY